MRSTCISAATFQCIDLAAPLISSPPDANFPKACHTPAPTYTLPMITRKTPTSTPPLRIGILGCANIAKQFTRDVRESDRVRVDAVASRNADTAAAYAAANGIARHHGSYEALLADPAIDAIYIPLPNSLHAEWAIKAAALGKHTCARSHWR